MVITEKCRLMKIIGGKYKGRKILVESESDYRPTLTRIREDIFNLLSHNNDLNIDLNEVIFCDLFAGTGSIGIEALSRGVKKVIFNDIEKKHTDKIEKFLKKINDVETSLCAKAERNMLQTIGGDCDTAIGGLAKIENHNLKLKAQLFSDNGQESFEYELTGREVDASFIGKSVGEKLLDLAGEKFKKK